MACGWVGDRVELLGYPLYLDMERRDFLLGTLTGVAAGAGVATLAARQPDEPQEPPSTASPPPVAPGPEIPATPTAADIGPAPPDGRRMSWAQQGEDLIVGEILARLKISAPRYLDIGAFHPTIGSNTFMAYVLGGSGVLVEPNPTMVDLLRRARPRDEVIAAGIGVDDRTRAEYFVVRDRPQLNTFSREQAERYGAGAVAQVIDMPLVSVGEVVDRHLSGGIDFLSIDVEGLDADILQRFPFERARPAVICCETLRYGTNAADNTVDRLLTERNYVSRGGSFVNTVFVDSRRL